VTALQYALLYGGVICVALMAYTRFMNKKGR
jgi:hypothetical protein